MTQVWLDVQLQNTCTASDEQPRLGSTQYNPIYNKREEIYKSEPSEIVAN